MQVALSQQEEFSSLVEFGHTLHCRPTSKEPLRLGKRGRAMVQKGGTLVPWATADADVACEGARLVITWLVTITGMSNKPAQCLGGEQTIATTLSTG